MVFRDFKAQSFRIILTSSVEAMMVFFHVDVEKNAQPLQVSWYF